MYKGILPTILSIAIFSTGVYYDLYAQQYAQDLEQWIQDNAEQGNLGANFDYITTIEELRYHWKHPINLNKATAQDLQELYFLHPNEIKAILQHRKLYGDFISIYELIAVKGLPLHRAKLLSRFCHVGGAQFRSEESWYRHILFAKTRLQMQVPRGMIPNENGEKRFSGNRVYKYLRYETALSKRVDMGMVLEKDVGESFADWKTFGADYRAMYLHYRPASKLLKNIVIGDYVIALGEGLLINNGFGIGKNSRATFTKSRSDYFRPYRGTAENSALRGIATQMNISPLISLSTFVSSRYRDANTKLDSNNQVYISSLQSSGLHRTNFEIEDKNSVRHSLYGASLQYHTRSGANMALQASYSALDLSLDRADRPYNQYRFEGDQLLNSSLSYNFHLFNTNVYGESAISDNGAMAHLIGAQYAISKTVDLSIHYRDFDKSYQTLFGNAFSETQGASNETGLYLGFSYHQPYGIKMDSYVDIWKHPWLRFRVDAPSSGFEWLYRLSYGARDNYELAVQLRYERKHRNTILENTAKLIDPTHLWRVRVDYRKFLGDSFEWRSRGEYSSFRQEYEHYQGYLIYQELIHRAVSNNFSLTARIQYFYIEDYDARIYAYERDLRNEFYVPFFNGEGWRYYLLARAKINNYLTAELKWGSDIFSDGRETISSGHNRIEGNQRNLLEAQLIAKF